MSKLVTVLSYTVCRTASTKPVFHASFTRWPLPTRKTDFVSLPITVEMSISRVIPRGTPSSVESEKAGRGGEGRGGEGKTAKVFVLLV